MKIYKVRAWVNQKRNRRGELVEHPYKNEEVCLNLETAKRIFQREKDEIKTWQGLVKYPSGKVEVFEPHIFEDGTLAYWPDNEVGYIDTWGFGDLNTEEK